MLPPHGPVPVRSSDLVPAVLSQSHAVVPVISHGPSNLDPKPDLMALLLALRSRWLMATGLGLLCGSLAAGIVALLTPPAKYTARAMLHVSSVPPKILLTVKEVYSDYGAYQRTQLALLKSRLVLNAALKREEVAKLKIFDTYSDPIEWLEKELQVDFANGSEILRISMSGRKAEELMLMVNAVTLAYLDEVVDVETKQRRERFDLLRETWNRYQESLREKRKELKRLTEMAGSDDKKTLANIHQHELDRLGRAEDELARIQSELRSLEVEYEVLQEEKNLSASAVTPDRIEEEIRQDRTIEALAERVEKAQKSYDKVSRLARQGNDPALQTSRRELDTAKSAYHSQRRKLYPIIEQELREASSTDVGTREVLLQRQIKVLTGIKESMADEVKRISARSVSLSRNSVDLFSIQEEIASADEVAKSIGVEVEALKLELQAPPRIRLLEKAEKPRIKDEYQSLRMAGLAGGGAFALALIGTSLWEFRARRVHSAIEVVHSLGLRVVGTLPILPERTRLGIANSEQRCLQWQNVLTESIDAARTALLHLAQTESIRAVMVASCAERRGKNLAGQPPGVQPGPLRASNPAD